MKLKWQLYVGIGLVVLWIIIVVFCVILPTNDDDASHVISADVPTTPVEFTATLSPTGTIMPTVTITPTETPVSQKLIPWDNLFIGPSYIFCEEGICIPGTLEDRKTRAMWYEGSHKGRENKVFYFPNLEGAYQMIPTDQLSVGELYRVCQGGETWPFFFDHGKDASEFVFAFNDCVIGEYLGQFIGTQRYGDQGILTTWIVDGYTYTVHYLDGAYTYVK